MVRLDVLYTSNPGSSPGEKTKFKIVMKSKLKKEEYFQILEKIQKKILEINRTIGYGISNEDRAFLELVYELLK